MKELKNAIIGIGVVSHIHIDSLLSKGEKIVALCDIDIAKADAANSKYSLNAKTYSSYVEMLEKEDIDCVHICTPHYLHAEMVVKALNKNIHVLCEKPLAISFKQLDEIEEAVKSSKAMLGVCQQRRFEPTSQYIKELFKDDPILSANGNLSWCRDANYYKHDDWRGKKDQEGGGVMINQALHTLDLIEFFMGMPDTCIAYTFNDLLKGVIDTEEAAYGIFKYNDGRRFLIEATNANNLSHEISIALKSKNHQVYYIGENLIVDNKQVAIKSEITDAGKKEWGYGHLYLISYFNDCIRNNKHFPLDFYEGSKVVRSILSMYESNGKEIKL